MTFIDEVISFCRAVTPYSIIATGLTIIVTTIAIVVKYKQQRAPDKDEKHQQAKTSAPSPPTTTKLRNVFDVKQSSNHSKVEKKGFLGKKSTKEEEEKPFRSSYYYAHNSARSNGGYKDGLRAEDYVMNGPRLLSRNGVTVGDADDADGDGINDKDDSSNEPSAVPSMTTNDNVSSSTAQPIALVPAKKANDASIPINRYLWDDDGNSDGIAKVYIDSIPGGTSVLNSSDIIKWADAGLRKSDVVAKLLGVEKNGLMVQIRRQDGIRYHLHVPKMYGEAQEVKLIVRPKKLIVKVYKKKKSKVWPELISKSAVAGGKSVDYVNEDLFRSME